MNDRNLFELECINRLHAQRHFLAILFTSFDHHPFDTLHSPVRSFVVFNRFFLSVHNPFLSEHLHVAVPRNGTWTPTPLIWVGWNYAGIASVSWLLDYLSLISACFSNFRHEWRLKLLQSRFFHVTTTPFCAHCFKGWMSIERMHRQIYLRFSLRWKSNLGLSRF